MTTLILIRHGATEGNLHKRYIGRTDEPLCDVGIAQVNALRKQRFPIDKLFVSPMRRAKETAEILFPGTAYTVIDDFRETDFGIFEGKSAAELSDNAEYQNWVNSFCQDPIPSGEKIEHFKERCCKAFAQIMQAESQQAVIAFVVHGGTIMAILEAYAKPRRGFYEYHIGNGEYIVCKYENGVISR
ncbi:MAG TPA: histidine phosphatase family protein [Candidatus Faecousia intestinigallinarum]|nr:histidine phosphatase family protein [Candidatus Faecousia intestinigallinarum]